MSREPVKESSARRRPRIPRRAALDALTDVTKNGAYANLRLKQACAGFSAQDARFIYALCYATLEHLLYLDHVLDACVQGRQKPLIRNILRMGCCELLFLNTPPHAAISESVALCRAADREAMCGFVNAVLRRIDRQRDALPPLPEDPALRLSIRYSCPLWIVALWLSAYGETETEALLSAQGPGLTVRAQYPCTTDALMAELPCPAARGRLDENALRLPAGLDVTALPAFAGGRLAVQGEGAMLLCRALSDCRGLRVLDACAAPGGKSAYLASLSENEIALTCFELHPHRLALMEKTLARLGVSASLIQRDAAQHDPAYDAAFDAVLLDVPCSGLGLLHEKPDIRYSKGPAEIDALAALQAKILAACAPYVRPGGLLVYGTCTISRKENEDQVNAFLAAHAEFRLERLPFAESGMLQLLPEVHGTDGFFVARMRRCI